MEIDPMEQVRSIDEEDYAEALDEGRKAERAKEARKGRLNTMIAIAVALLATFMGICKVKDDNIVQAMQQAQAKSVDDWNYYQARNIRSELAQATADQMRLAKLGQPASSAAAYDKQIKTYQASADDQSKKKAATKADAEEDGKTYDAYNFHDDQFDLSDALLSIAISLFALTALTQKRWLFAIALIPTFFGVLMGLAGLLAWRIHPDVLTRLLS